MRFRALQDNLRKELLKRVEAGDLTGLKLAAMTGFQQAHISNFLNKKRGLSIEGMDKVLQVQKISVLDLLDPAEVSKRATIPAPSPDDFDNVLLVDAPLAATKELVISDEVKDILKFKKAFLKRLKADSSAARQEWTRFLLIKADGNDATSMYPRLLPGATLLIDRHYTSLKPYRKNEQNMYAVRKNDTCTVKYVELQGGNLILRPHNQAYPVDVIAIEEGKSYADYIVGRVCHVAIET
jgi:transcriptional regulator with XRE-family HTH domain